MSDETTDMQILHTLLFIKCETIAQWPRNVSVDCWKFMNEAHRTRGLVRDICRFGFAFLSLSLTEVCVISPSPFRNITS
jgi:hypothetical protein